MGDTTLYTYNSRGQITAIRGTAQYPVDYVYDSYGRMTQLLTYRGSTADTTTWAYHEPSGLLTSKTYADGNAVGYTYSVDGKLSTRTWARGAVTNYAYDSATGELTGITYSDSTPAVGLAYNRLGQKASVTDVAGTRSFGYNNYFDLTSETISGIYGKTISRTYDSFGRASGMSIGAEYNIGYAYDSVGRLSSLTNGSDAFTYGYLANSDLVSVIACPNSMTVARSYESQRDLISSVENKYGAFTISKYGYANDVIGRRSNMTKEGSAFTQADVISYGYNTRSEVTSASAANETLYNYAYAFDNIGNRLTASERGVSSAYTSNNLNQYTAIDIIIPTYDSDGNMLTNGSGWTFTWDAENRLASATDGSQTLNFKYDYMSRRVEKTVSSGGSASKRERFVYDGYLQVERLNALDGNAVLQKFVRAGETLLSMTDANGTYYYTQDGNKNISELVDSTGSVRSHYEYGPFGQIVSQSGDLATANPFRFSSEFADDESGLVYYNYRYYSPELGRWTKRDDAGEQGGYNLYAIVDNSPTNWWDYLGNGKRNITNKSGKVVGTVNDEGTNCAGYACRQGGELQPVTIYSAGKEKASSLSELLSAIGYKCTKNISGCDCKKHCDCKDYIMLYVYIIKTFDFDKVQNKYKDRDMFEEPYQGPGDELDFHAIRGEEDGTYTYQPHRFPNSQPPPERFTPTKSQCDYFPDEKQILGKYCCCKK